MGIRINKKVGWGTDQFTPPKDGLYFYDGEASRERWLELSSKFGKKTR